jgi:hypothetical protein
MRDEVAAIAKKESVTKEERSAVQRAMALVFSYASKKPK